MNFLKSHLLILILPLLLFASCGKGYEVRFTNYYTEPIDSVVIGENKLVLKDVELQDDTDYYALSKGKYNVQIISKTKKRFYTSITIPASGTGKRTIQIDAIEQIYVLEE
jgi:hypothetical protein